MAKHIRLLLFLLIIIFFITFIGIIVGLFVALQNERAGKETLQSELTQIMKERKKISSEIEELRLIKGDLELKVRELETQLNTATENYQKEKSQREIVGQELSQKLQELNEIKAKLDAVTLEKDKLQETHNEEKEKYDRLKERIDKLVEVKEILEAKVKDIIDRQGISLERIVVKAEGELEGKVLVVNRDYNFIVVDIGNSDDIALGDTLLVFRSGKYVGEAQIEKIYDTMSAATIVKEEIPKGILINDDVIVRGN